MTTVSALRRADALDLEALAKELLRRQETKYDLVVDTRKINWFTGDVDSDDRASYVTVDGAEALTPTSDGWRVNEHAHGQIADRIGVPKRYYDRMRNEAPRLLDTNVRHWFDHKPETRMIRTLDGNVRAFLSDRFRRLDDLDLMEHLIPVFEKIPGLQFQVASLTDTRLHVRALLPTIEREIKVGDTVQAGIEIKNSEVGAGALTIAPFVWRLVCLNGMVMPKAVSRNHVGRRIDEDDANVGMYREETIAADDRAFYLKVADVVGATLTEAAFDEIVRPLREAATGEKIAAPIAATQILGKTYGIDEGEQESILTRLTQGGDLSRWGMANAITAAAKDAPGWDRLAELEAIGGQVATMEEKDWERVAVAA